MIRLLAMLRAPALLCAAILVQAIDARTWLEHAVSQSACAADDADGRGSSTGDEALAGLLVVIAQPAAPRQGRWEGADLSTIPSPAPDEILHVPRPLLA